MRLLLRDADFRQVLDQNLGFDFEFPRQLIDADLIGFSHYTFLSNSGYSEAS